MPKIVVRKGYRCLPGKRRELLAALQRLDAVAMAAGWPRGRYLLVETKSPGEPDLEVEFTFGSYGEMEQLERRLREHLSRAGHEAGTGGQELLIEPSATRYLLLVDEPVSRAVVGTATAAAGGRPLGPSTPRQGVRQRPAVRPDEPPDEPPDELSDEPPAEAGEPELPPRPSATTAQDRARQLAEARNAMELAERSVGMPAARRASQRRLDTPGPSAGRRPSPDRGSGPAPGEDEAGQRPA